MLDCILSYVGSTTVNKELIRLKTIGHEWATAFGHNVKTLSFSKNANKQLLQGSAPFKLSNEELFVLFSSWKPKTKQMINYNKQIIINNLILMIE